MSYDPSIHHRRSFRLKGYDYSQAGLYFITICAQDRACLFGEITVGATLCCPHDSAHGCPEMKLNDAGRMVEKWYWELENKYPDKHCQEMIIMPNHFHCIIENIPMDATEMDATDMDAHVGAPLRGRPENATCPENATHPQNDGRPQNITFPASPYGINNKKYGATIGTAMDWLKTMTTNEYIRGVKSLNWPTFNGKLWQRNFYEHIIRNEKSYNNISEYIINNPSNWTKDKLNKK